MKKKIYVIAAWDYMFGPAYPSALKKSFGTFKEAKAFVEESAREYAREHDYTEDTTEVRWDSENHADLTYGFDDLVAYSIEKVEVDIE